jgi:hypothetical protein
VLCLKDFSSSFHFILFVSSKHNDYENVTILPIRFAFSPAAGASICSDATDPGYAKGRRKQSESGNNSE